MSWFDAAYHWVLGIIMSFPCHEEWVNICGSLLAARFTLLRNASGRRLLCDKSRFHEAILRGRGGRGGLGDGGSRVERIVLRRGLFPKLHGYVVGGWLVEREEREGKRSGRIEDGTSSAFSLD